MEVIWPIRQKVLFDFLASRACSLTPEYRGLHSLAIGLGFMHKLFYFGHLAFGFWPFVFWPQRSLIFSECLSRHVLVSCISFSSLAIWLLAFGHLAFGLNVP